jgi:hypothetical protein
MKLRYLYTLIGLLILQASFAQKTFVRYDSVSVTLSGELLTNPWAGGLNSPQFSDIDLNGDGIKDLFVFERGSHGIVKTFINNGKKNTVDYEYAPAYQQKFPTLRYWALLVDYNCDGKEDIFTHASGGIAVYRNDYNETDGLTFTLVSPLLYTTGLSSRVNIYVASPDLPAIIDVDNDGDLDILTFGVGGSSVEYHKNYSVEKYGTCDSLDFELRNTCWGYFYEDGLSNEVSLFDTCSGNVSNPDKHGRHAGSTLLALDLSGNGVKDLILGDISFNNMVMLTNGGEVDGASMTAFDYSYPSNTVPVNIPIFPAAFYLDVDNDNKKDLLVAPNSSNASENLASVWFYKNTGTASSPIFTHQYNDFLQKGMIEVGQGAHPIFFDYNADGLLDIVIGNDGYYNNGSYKGELSLYENVGTLLKPSFAFVTRDYAGLSSLSLKSVYPAFGDLDDDDDIDMVVGDDQGKLHYFNNTAGIGNTANFVLAQSNYQGIDIGQNATPQLVDVNKDGKLDLLIGERGGTLNYFENMGSIFNPVFSASPTNDFFGDIDVMIPCCTGYSVPFMSKNSMGNSVLYVSTEQGYVHQYNNIDGNLNGSFTKLDSLYVNGRNISVSGADINNDGVLELVYGEWFGGIAILKEGNSTSINDDKKVISQVNFQLYPNPARTTVLVNVQGVKRGERIEVMVLNTLGNQVFSKTIEHSEIPINIPVDELSSGIYWVRVKVNQQWVSQKLLKY